MYNCSKTVLEIKYLPACFTKIMFLINFISKEVLDLSSIALLNTMAPISTRVKYLGFKKQFAVELVWTGCKFDARNSPPKQ